METVQAPQSSPPSNDQGSLKRLEDIGKRAHAIEAFRSYLVDVLQKNNVFGLIPSSGKVIVFDSELQVRHAFIGLMQNMINSAVVWNNDRYSFVGMLSISDFLEILHHVLRKKRLGTVRRVNSNDPSISRSQSTSRFAEDISLSALEDIASLRIVQWQGIMCYNNKSVPKLLSIDPESSLIEAIRSLVQLRVHRLAVTTNTITNTVLCVLSQHRVLAFILCALKDKKELLDVTLEDVRLGVYGNSLMTTTPDIKIEESIDILLTKCVSSLPVVWGDLTEKLRLNKISREEFETYARHLPPGISPNNATAKTYLGLHTRADFRTIAANEKYLASDVFPEIRIERLLPTPISLTGLPESSDGLGNPSASSASSSTSGTNVGASGNTNSNTSSGSGSGSESSSTNVNSQNLHDFRPFSASSNRAGAIGVPTLSGISSKYPDRRVYTTSQVEEFWRRSPCCRKDDSLYTICMKMYLLDKHQLICVDDNWGILGIVAMTDFYCFLLKTDLSIPTTEDRLAINTFQDRVLEHGVGDDDGNAEDSQSEDEHGDDK